MLKNLKLLAILTAGPVLAFVLLTLADSKLLSTWQKGLAQNTQGATSLPSLCADVTFRKTVESACSTMDHIRLARTTAIWTVFLGLALLGAIVLAGRLCDADRQLLLVLFKPGLYLTNFGVCILILLQAAVVVTAVYYAETIFIGRITTKLLLLFALGAGLGVILLIKASLGMVHRARTEVLGKSLSSAAYPELWKYVNQLSAEVGTAGPKNLVVGLDPTFYVTEADVSCIDGELSGRTMYLSLSLCRIMSLAELKAVIAHELGHFKGQDTEFSLKFYPIYRGATDSLEAVASAADHSDTGALALLPAIHMLGFFLESFAVAENKISRERELAADAVAAAAAGADNLASALVKIVAFSSQWEPLYESMAQGFQTGTVMFAERQYEAKQFFSNISKVFALMVAQAAEPAALANLGAIVIPHPTDSHPPLHVRLTALGATVESVAGKALQTGPAEPASSLIENLEGLEEELSRIQHHGFLQPA